MRSLADNPRARLLDATVELLATRGYRQMSVETLVAHAGVDACVFHEQFADRETCVLAAFEEVIQCCSARMVEACRGDLRWHARVSAGLPALLAFLDEHPLAARFAVVETLGATSAVLRRRSETLARLVRFVDGGRREASPAMDASPVVAERLVFAVLTIVHESLLSGSRVPLATLSGPLTSLILLPYLGEHPAHGELDRFARCSQQPSPA